MKRRAPPDFNKSPASKKHRPSLRQQADDVYLSLVHKSRVYNTNIKLQPSAKCGTIYQAVCSKLKLNMKRVLLMNESHILRTDQSIGSTNLLTDNTVYVIDMIRDQLHVIPSQKETDYTAIPSRKNSKKSVSNQPTEMSVYVAFIDQKRTITLYANPEHTIQDLKNKLEIQTGISPQLQRLMLRGKQCHHLRTLSSYGILKSGQLLNLFERKRGGEENSKIPINVKTLTGKTYIIHVAPHDTIYEVKRTFQSSTGVPIEQQRLIYQGQQLQDGDSLTDYGIGRNTTIVNFLKLRGS